jgi:hypothetical protein
MVESLLASNVCTLKHLIMMRLEGKGEAEIIIDIKIRRNSS